jgi:hypothetical protein
VFLVAGAGYGLRRAFTLDAKTLSTLNIYLFIPCLVFARLAQRSFDGWLLAQYVLASGMMVLFMWVILAALARWRGLKGPENSAFLMTMFSNLGNFGLPVATFAFGEEGLALAILVMVGGMLFQNSAGVFFAHRSRHSASRALLYMFRFPVLYAFAVTLVAQYFAWQPPEVFGRAIALTGDAAIPVQLLILGIKLGETKIHVDVNVFLAVGVRLLLGPLVGLGIVALIGLEGLAAHIFILQMSGPVAVSMAVYAVQYDVAPRYLASVVSWSFLFSAVTVSVVLTILFQQTP